MLTTSDQEKLMAMTIRMIEETLFTKERDLEYANLQKLTEKDWEIYVQKTQHEIKVLTSKLKFYKSRYTNMFKKDYENSNDTKI